MQVPVDDELPDVAVDFVAARGARFNEGEVLGLCSGGGRLGAGAGV